jgi:hypothetical protein
VAGGSSVKSFFTGPQTLVTVDDLLAFVRRAPAGESLIYCAAPELIRSETSARVNDLAAEGLVRPHRRRRAGGGWEYFVVRTGKGLATRLDPGRGCARGSRDRPHLPRFEARREPWVPLPERRRPRAQLRSQHARPGAAPGAQADRPRARPVDARLRWRGAVPRGDDRRNRQVHRAAEEVGRAAGRRRA